MMALYRPAQGSILDYQRLRLMDVSITFLLRQAGKRPQKIWNGICTGANSKRKWSKIPFYQLVFIRFSFSLLNKFQKFNHFEGCWNVGRKDRLYTHIMNLQKEFPSAYNFLPKTYFLQYNLYRFYPYLLNLLKADFSPRSWKRLKLAILDLQAICFISRTRHNGLQQAQKVHETVWYRPRVHKVAPFAEWTEIWSQNVCSGDQFQPTEDISV